MLRLKCPKANTLCEIVVNALFAVVPVCWFVPHIVAIAIGMRYMASCFNP